MQTPSPTEVPHRYGTDVWKETRRACLDHSSPAPAETTSAAAHSPLTNRTGTIAPVRAPEPAENASLLVSSSISQSYNTCSSGKYDGALVRFMPMPPPIYEGGCGQSGWAGPSKHRFALKDCAAARARFWRLRCRRFIKNSPPQNTCTKHTFHFVDPPQRIQRQNLHWLHLQTCLTVDRSACLSSS